MDKRMIEQIKTLDDLFNKVDLYNELRFELFKKNGEQSNYILDKNVLSEVINILGIGQKTITTLCRWCKMLYPFVVDMKTDYIPPQPYMAMGSYGVLLAKELYINLDGSLSSIKKGVFSEDDLFSLHTCTFEYSFDCTKDDKHHYKMYLFVKREKQFLSIIKIGQFPSMIDIWGFDFDIYKKQLKKIEAYIDFKRAELCFADGFTAGAFTYLRRVFEKMLEEYCKGIDLPYNAHTEAKIDACKEKFDPRIHSMLPGLYKILSKGIHQLDDEEAKNYYLYLRTVIVMQLQHIKEINDKDEQTAALSKTIQEIAEKIK